MPYCLSDSHLASVLEAGDLFPRRMKNFGPVRGPQVYAMFKRELLRSFVAVTESIRASAPETIVHLGDLSGGSQECGIAHPLVDQTARHASRILDGLPGTTFISPGNHDTGYGHGEVSGHFDAESLLACRDIYGPLWWRFEEASVLYVGFCTPLAEARCDSQEVIRMQHDQEQFLGDTLLARPEGWVLMTHNIFGTRTMAKQLQGHTKRMRMVVCGDLHQPSWGNRLSALGTMLQFLNIGALGRKAEQVMFECMSKLVICPASAPLGVRGYSYLKISGTDKLRAEVVPVERPAGYEELPVSSFLRAALWFFGVG